MTIKTLGVLFAATLLTAGRPAMAQEDAAVFQATTLRLSATGSVRATPDIATIALGVETQAPNAAEALRQNGAAMTATLAALKSQGLSAKDIQTSGLMLNPQYIFHEGEARKLNGYEASNSVTVIVRDLSRLGATVDAVVAAGANHVNGVSFGLSDPQRAEDEARRAAVKSLQAKAALYAEAAGYHLARLVSLSDTSTSDGAMNIHEAPVFKLVRATPTEPGELDVTANVAAVYELKK
jgi:uncharacterized protein YggE